MRSELLAALACVAALCAGCPASPFRCGRAIDCNAGSVCTYDNACAEPAAACPSGYRYSSSAARGGDCVPSTNADAATDATVDATRDATPDATRDAAPDATRDAAPDATLDAAPDGTPDAAPDGTPDAAPDVPAVIDAPIARDVPDVPAVCRVAVQPLAPLSTTRVSSTSARLRLRVPDGFAGSVEITVADSADMTRNARTTTIGADARELVPAALTAGVHFWQARARCTNGVAGPTSPVWSFRTRGGVSPREGAGNVVGWMHDVNGDGLGDIVVGAPRTSASLGRPQLVAVLGAMSSTAERRFSFGVTGAAPDTLGQQVVVVPDMNGDGLADIATSACVRAPAAGCDELVVVFAGSRDGSFPVLARLTPGAVAGSRFGTSLAGVGDVDGDGYGDLAIGAPGLWNAGVGRLYMVFGGPAGLTMSAPIERAVSTVAPTASLFGHSVAGVGDVTGDGLADVLVTAYESATIFAGGPRWRGPTPNPDGTDVPEPRNVEAVYGYSASAAGDINDDGGADFVIARPGLNVVTLYQGVSPAGGRIAALRSIEHPPSERGVSEHFGYTIASGGDISGDEVDDLLVAAPDATGGGAVYELVGGATPGAEFTIPRVPGGAAPFGQGLSIVGDFDGDGDGDAAISTGHTSAILGGVHVFLGNGGRPPGVTFDATLTEPTIHSFGTALARR
jgi:hypothetical protein